MRAPYSALRRSVVVGHSPRMRAIFDFVKVVSRSDSSVIITGESGTGKEVIANLLHHSEQRAGTSRSSPSAARCSPRSLIETELFGHERGAFTGAIKDKPGRFELAQGGTLFLDDIDDVPLSMQVKLLRALQNRHGRAGRRHAHDPRQRARHHRHASAISSRWSPKASSARTCTTG